MAHMTQMKKWRCNVTCTYIFQCNTVVYTMCTTRSHKEEYSFIPFACAECNDSLPFSGDSSIPPCYIPFPSTLFHQLVFHPPSLQLAVPLSLIVSKFIYNSFLGILVSSILCTCPNQRNLFNLIVSVMVGFFNHCINFFMG